jgi:hypothetical protein
VREVGAGIRGVRGTSNERASSDYYVAVSTESVAYEALVWVVLLAGNCERYH